MPRNGSLVFNRTIKAILNSKTYFKTMKNNRRDFLKLSSLAGIGIAGSSILKGFAAEPLHKPWVGNSGIQTFNMSGYSAPKLDTVRVGFIGLGQRGPSHLNAISKIEGTEIKALCDLRPESVNKAKKTLDGTGHNPALYSGNKEEWKKLCDRKDIDLRRDSGHNTQRKIGKHEHPHHRQCNPKSAGKQI